MGIAISTIIVQGFHAGDADRNFGEAFAPRSPETIGDDDWNGKLQAFFQFAMELCRGAVRDLSGSRSAWRPPSTLETSTPLLAQIRP